MKLPPRLRNAENEIRRVGFELEFSGLDVGSTAKILESVLNGKLEKIEEFTADISSSLGTFHIEFDSKFFKEKQYEEYLRAVGFSPSETIIGRGMEKALIWLGSVVIPFEIVTPPLLITNMEIVEAIREALKDNSAKGATSAPFRAFGLQFNPEVPDKSSATLTSYLKAFFLLFEWLQDKSALPVSRKLAPYVNPFPQEYMSLLVNPSYQPDLKKLMTDYLDFNPTRNRPLDLLPLFAEIDLELLSRYPIEMDLVKPRPTFHYRLPNCEVDVEGWTIGVEWDRWIKVEELANDPVRLEAMCKRYFKQPRQ